jgi:phage terminase large subunit
MAIWVVQWVGNQVNVLDYIEGQGQVLAYYVNELRCRKWHPVCYLPHDGINANNVTGKRCA